MANDIRIEIDIREPELIRTALSSEVTCTTKSLVVGDYIIYVNNEPRMCIERKTVDDLHASIKDGRFRDQRQRMLETGIPIVYILEGRLYVDKSIQGALENLAIVHNIPVISSVSMQQTVSIIKSLGKKLSVPVSKNPGTVVTYNAPRAKSDTLYSSLEKMLTTIPGVSGTIAKSIGAKYKTMAELLAAIDLEQDKCLQNVSIESKTLTKKPRRLGPALSKRIVAACTEN